MATTYTKLNNGQWGVRVQGWVPMAGETVTVTKRSGQRNQVVVDRVIWSGNGTALCSIRKEEGRRQEAPVPVEVVAARMPVVHGHFAAHTLAETLRKERLEAQAELDAQADLYQLDADTQEQEKAAGPIDVCPGCGRDVDTCKFLGCEDEQEVRP